MTPPLRRDRGGRDVVGGVLDGAVAPQVVVEGAVDLVLVQAEDDVDARRLNVGVHDADAQPLRAARMAERLAVMFDLPVPPRKEWTETILAMITFLEG